MIYPSLGDYYGFLGDSHGFFEIPIMMCSWRVLCFLGDSNGQGSRMQLPRVPAVPDSNPSQREATPNDQYIFSEFFVLMALPSYTWHHIVAVNQNQIPTATPWVLGNYHMFSLRFLWVIGDYLRSLEIPLDSWGNQRISCALR